MTGQILAILFGLVRGIMIGIGEQNPFNAADVGCAIATVTAFVSERTTLTVILSADNAQYICSDIAIRHPVSKLLLSLSHHDCRFCRRRQRIIWGNFS